MVASFKAIMSMASQKGLESINGQTENFIKVNGLAVLSMVLECGMESRATIMSGSGNLERLMAMEFMYGSTEIDTKGSLSNV